MRDIKELDAAQTLARQRREWAVQNVGWAVMVLMVLGVALGFLGGGRALCHAHRR
jgi:hypothetical protein